MFIMTNDDDPAKPLTHKTIAPLPRTLTIRIPPEIIAHILTYLPPNCLLACAHVSKAWLLLSRTLFASRPSSPLTPLIIHDNTQNILPLLASPNSTLTPHVRTVCACIVDDIGMRWLPGALRGAPIERLVVRLAPPITREEGAEMLAWMGGYTHSLVELGLVGIRGIAVSEFKEMLRRLGVLKHLAIVNVDWMGAGWDGMHVESVGEQTQGVESSERQEVLPCLSSLILEGLSIHIIEWLKNVLQGGVSQITSLDLRTVGHPYNPLPNPPFNIEVDEYTAELMVRYYRTLGGALRELDLYPLPFPLTLQYNTHLQRIWFHELTLNPGTTGQWIIDALGTLPVPSCIENIALEVFSHPRRVQHVEREFDWAAFSRVVGDRARFPCLQKVEVVLTGLELSLVGYIALIMPRILDSLGKVAEEIGVEVDVQVEKRERLFGFLMYGRVGDRMH